MLPTFSAPFRLESMATTLQIIRKERFGNLQEITMETITDFVNKPPAWFTGLAPAGVMYWYIFLGVAGTYRRHDSVEASENAAV